MKKLSVLISGRVQGVCFRAYAQDKAISLSITGWIKNLPTGEVEALIEGEPPAVEEMIAWCYQGSPYSKVNSVKIFELPANNFHNSFQISY